MGCCQSKGPVHTRNNSRKTSNRQQNTQQNDIEPQLSKKQTPEKVQQIQVHKVKRKQPHKNYPRQFLQPKAKMSDDFLTHHLKHQLTLTKLTSMKRIRRRQLVEHLWLQGHLGKNGGLNELKIDCRTYQQSLISAWTQRTFIELWRQAHEDIFVNGQSFQSSLRKLVEQFMFQLYQLKQFIESGLGMLNFMIEETRIQLNSYVELADDALFHVINRLKEKYHQTAVKHLRNIPQIKNMAKQINLLDHFPSKSFSEPQYLNYQTIYEDLTFLLKRAAEQYQDFKSDMEYIFGQARVSLRVCVNKSEAGDISFNAVAVRRLLLEWAHNIIEACPDIKTTKVFMKFMRRKSTIVDNFIFKSTVRPTTHKIVNDCLSLMLEAAKFDPKTRNRRPQFIFNIYDLLRCKVKCKNTKDVVALSRKIELVVKTKSGKLFQVIKVNNILPNNHRGLVVNFRYGDVLVSEARIKIQNQGENNLNHSVNNYFHRLEKSLFGPTIDIMMQYEDFQKPDLTVVLEAEGLVCPRDSQLQTAGKIANRVCPQGHQMMSLIGNHFIRSSSQLETSQEMIKAQITTLCQFCDRSSTLQQQYDYCFQCGCYLCKECRGEYENMTPENNVLNIQRAELFPEIRSINDIQKMSSSFNSLIVLFWLEGSSSSIMLKDCMAFHQAKLKRKQDNFVPIIAHFRYSANSQFKKMIHNYSLQAYPTLILFDNEAKPFKTIIGFSWFQVPNLYAIQHLLVQGKGISSLSLYCVFCSERMEAEQQIRDDKDTCINCFSLSKKTYIPTEVVNCGVYCQNNHYRCMNCCYGVLDCPSTFKDFSGGDYMSSQFVAPYLGNCQQGHQVTLNKSGPSQKWEFQCWDCGQRRLFDNQHGIGQCRQCKMYLCSRCIGAQEMNLKQMYSNICMVRHFVESTAEQVHFCSCQRPFKHVYSTRYSSLEELKDETGKTWKCVLCEGQKKQGQLHLACFACPTLSAEGTRQNVQICMKCANKANMTLTAQIQHIQQQQSLISCPNDYKLLYFTSRRQNESMTFDCSYCKKKYFQYTPKFYCKQCQLYCCYDCRENLWKKAPLMTKHVNIYQTKKCDLGHTLQFQTVPKKGLIFCNGCCHTITADQTFMCQKDNYYLCLQCTKNKPVYFIGMAHTKAKSQQISEYNIEEVSENCLYGPFEGYTQKSQESWDEGDHF